MKSPFAAALCSCLLATAAWTGAAVAAEPTTPSPGTVQDTLRQQPPQPPLPVTPAMPLRGDVNPALAPSTGPRVQVHEFVLNGNEAFTDQELSALLAPWIGRALSLNDIYTAADQLTTYYREHGYGLAQVTVPAQKISDGSIELQVIEGRIGAISVSGNDSYSFEFLKRRLDPLTPGLVYTDRGMERSVLLLNDLPGLSARAVIKPGDEFGTSDILFRIEEDHAKFSASVDNYGREELGEIRLSADGEFNNLAGYGDRLYIAALVSEDALLTYGNVTYGVPIGDNGSRLRLTANRADYEVGGELFEALGITGDNTTYRADWSYPLLRSRRANIVFSAAVQRFETESLQLDVPNATALDLAEFGLFMNGLLERGDSWSFSALLSGNGKSNGDTVLEQRPDAQQAKLRLDGSYGMPFADKWLALSRATWVYSGDPLTDSQKFSLGGPYSVRGYAPAELRGDRGAFLSLELRRYFLAGSYPLAAALFVEGGFAENLAFSDTPADTDLKSELGSAGVGLLLSPDSGRFSGALLYAQPVDNHTSLNGDDDGHVWATFTYRF